MQTKHSLCYKNCLEIKIYLKKLRLRQNFDICIRNLDTNKERQKTNIFERKVYGRILGPVNENEKENCRI